MAVRNGVANVPGLAIGGICPGQCRLCLRHRADHVCVYFFILTEINNRYVRSINTTLDKTELGSELSKHGYIIAILLISFFPLYLMFNISFKTTKRFLSIPGCPRCLCILKLGRGLGNCCAREYNTIFAATTSVVLTFGFTIPVAFFFALQLKEV